MSDFKPILSLQNVDKKFQGKSIIKDISFDLNPGEVISILGPSGCGKSTLIQLLCGFFPIDSGTLTWNTDILKGVVFQDSALLPWSTVLKNVILPLRLQKLFTPQERLQKGKDILEKVGLSAFLQSYPHQISGGMKMRVALARALILEPKVLLLDEPFASLDELTKLKLIEELLNLWDKMKWSAVMITHSIQEALLLSHKVIILSSLPGQIKRIITIDEPFPRTLEFSFTDKYQKLKSEIQHQLLRDLN